MLVVLDYGVGNVGSIRKMLLKSGVDVVVSGRSEDVDRAEKLVLPGVGAFDDAMERLEASGLLAALCRRVLEEEVPILGICLGMQMLGTGSEEGSRPGLGWLDARSVRLSPPGLRVPHVGWNAVGPRADSPLFADLEAGHRFYFMHSYRIECADPGDIAAVSDYGTSFTCAVRRGNIHGVQFHPEKSHESGRRLLARFARQDHP